MALTTSARGQGLVAAINVTPMADIMIVLLIIFMVVTPLVDRGPVERLPAAANAREQGADRGRVLVFLTATGGTYLDGRRLDVAGELFPGLQARFAEKPGASRVVFLQADERLPFSDVERVMDLCREAGAEQVALIARQRLGG